jgi:hypothetical protein
MRDSEESMILSCIYKFEQVGHHLMRDSLE